LCATGSGSRSVTRIECRCIPATTGAGCIVTPCAPLRERCSRLRRSPRLTPARLKGRATRPATTRSPRVTSFAYDGARPKSSLRSKVARRGRRASWKRRRSSARPLRWWVVRALRVKAPPRPGSAKPRVGAPVCRRNYVAAAPPQRRIMDPLCVRSPPATARADAVRVWGFTRWGFRAHRRAGTERGSVPLALPGRGCVVGDAGNDRAEHRRRSRLLAPPCGSAPRRGRPRWSRRRRSKVGAHGARFPPGAGPAPRVRRLCSLKGNPPLRARFPWPDASSLRPRAPRAKTRASSQSSASSVRPHPSPDSRHESCGANFRAGPDAPRCTRRANGVGTPGCLRFASGRGFAALV